MASDLPEASWPPVTIPSMDDGAILASEPPDDAPIAATVLGEEVRANDADEMRWIILSRLFDHYAAQHNIKLTEAEIEAFVASLKRGLKATGLSADSDLTPEEAAQVDAMRREMARAMIRQWKINRQLHRTYGGRVIHQQLGPEPLDAYRRFLDERQRAGAFAIHEKAFESAFWRYFTDDSRHSFFAPGDEASAFEVPPWER